MRRRRTCCQRQRCEPGPAPGAGPATGTTRRLRPGVRDARQRGVQWPQRLSGIEQHPWRIAPAGGVERDLGAQQIAAGALQCIQRPGIRDRQQRHGGFGRTRVVFGAPMPPVDGETPWIGSAELVEDGGTLYAEASDHTEEVLDGVTVRSGSTWTASRG